jgi:hypothetical protein
MSGSISRPACWKAASTCFLLNMDDPLSRRPLGDPAAPQPQSKADTAQTVRSRGITGSVDPNLWVTIASEVIRELNVIVGGWRPVRDADSGQRRLTLFPNVVC